jgi:small subunit ribosomal protein S6
MQLKKLFLHFFFVNKSKSPKFVFLFCNESKKRDFLSGENMSVRRVYETIFIVNAALEDQDVDSLITRVTNYIENHGGVIQEINKWGRRRLAYPINKKYNGFYVHIIFDALASTVPILERFLVLEDTILRHLTLQLPKKLRDFREKRALEQGRALGIPTDDNTQVVAAPKVDEVKEEVVEA